MPNIAINKKFIEAIIKPEEATRGNIENYTGQTGFSWAEYPCTFTLDLENVVEIDTIRFLLFDLDHRKYKYRLLTSNDLKNWNIHYDTGASGFSGWQIFQFNPKIKSRYVRIHGLWNSVNEGFHVVQIEVYSSTPPRTEKDPNNEQLISIASNIEYGDGLPLTDKINAVLSDLKNLPTRYPILDSGYFKNIVLNLATRSKDVETIEKNISSIRREIIDPINKELKKSKGISIFSGDIIKSCG